MIVLPKKNLICIQSALKADSRGICVCWDINKENLDRYKHIVALKSCFQKKSLYGVTSDIGSFYT